MDLNESTALFDGTHQDFQEVLETPTLLVSRGIVVSRPTPQGRDVLKLCIAEGLHSLFEVRWDDIPVPTDASSVPENFQLERTGVYYGETESDDMYFFYDAQRGRSCSLREDDCLDAVHVLFPKQTRALLSDLYDLPSGASETLVRQAINGTYNYMLAVTSDSLWLRRDLSLEEDRSGEEEAVQRVLRRECSVLEAVRGTRFNVRRLSTFGTHFNDIVRLYWHQVDVIATPSFDNPGPVAN